MFPNKDGKTETTEKFSFMKFSTSEYDLIFMNDDNLFQLFH